MKTQITITWNPENLEETTVSYSQAFNAAPRITKLDMLQDAIADLERRYNSELASFRAEAMPLCQCHE